MKITAVDTVLLRVPTQQPIALEFPEQGLVVASIRTDEGVTGLGYTLAMGGGGAEAILVYLETRLKPLLIGQDPLFVERLWERMYRGDRGIKRQGIAGYAISALDIGLWDIVGKAANMPLYKLWGAVTDRVPAYGSGGWPAYSVDDVINEAQRYVALGCRSRPRCSKTSTSCGTRSRCSRTISPPAPRSPTRSASPSRRARTTTRASSSAS